MSTSSLAYTRAYQETHRDRIKAQRAAHFQAHKAEIVEARRLRRTADPEQAERERGYAAAHYQANAATYKARSAAWQKADRRRKFVNWANRRARQVGAVGHLDWRDLPELPAPCRYCGGEALGFDHVVPFVSGGTNTVDNLVPCCLLCNERKNRFPVDQFVKGPAGSVVSQIA